MSDEAARGGGKSNAAIKEEFDRIARPFARHAGPACQNPECSNSDLGGGADVKKRLDKAWAEFDFGGKAPSEIVVIDGVPRASASHQHRPQGELPV